MVEVILTWVLRALLVIYFFTALYFLWEFLYNVLPLRWSQRYFYGISQHLHDSALAHRKRKHEDTYMRWSRHFPASGSIAPALGPLMMRNKDAAHLFTFKQLWWLGCAGPNVTPLNIGLQCWAVSRKPWKRYKIYRYAQSTKLSHSFGVDWIHAYGGVLKVEGAAKKPRVSAFRRADLERICRQYAEAKTGSNSGQSGA